jgi:ferredoxin
MRAEIDRDLCMGYGECVLMAPHLFVVDKEGFAVDHGDDAAWSDLESARLAAAGCPTQAIVLVDDQRSG